MHPDDHGPLAPDPTRLARSFRAEELVGPYLCVTVVTPDTPLTAGEVARRLGGDPADLRPREPGEVLPDWSPDDGVYLLSEQADRWIVVEANDFQGTRREVQRALSAAAVTHTLLLGVNSDRFLSARDGVVLVEFDLVTPEDRVGADPHALDADLAPMLRARDADPDLDVRDHAVDLLLRGGGVSLNQDWRDGPHLVLPAPHLPSDPPPPPGPLQAALDGAPPAVLGPVLREAVLVALQATGLADAPPVRQALDDVNAVLPQRAAAAGAQLSPFAPPPPWTRPVREALERLAPFLQVLDEAYRPRDLRPEEAPRRGQVRPSAPPQLEDPVWHRMQAGTALHILLVWAAMPGHAFFTPHEVLLHVRFALHDRWPAFESTLIERLR